MYTHNHTRNYHSLHISPQISTLPNTHNLSDCDSSSQYRCAVIQAEYSQTICPATFASITDCIVAYVMTIKTLGNKITSAIYSVYGLTKKWVIIHGLSYIICIQKPRPPPSPKQCNQGKNALQWECVNISTPHNIMIVTMVPDLKNFISRGMGNILYGFK